jgi:transcriptional regulator of arginine metabolism
MTSANRRRDAVARIIRNQRISTQEELLEAVKRAGFSTTQATLSRDLAKLGARRASQSEGGAVYELSEPGAGIETFRELVASISSNGSLVVMKTHPGSAAAIARAIDLAGLPEVLGTLAGDDTIFVAPAGRTKAGALTKGLARLFGLSNTAVR